jgi:hypothetical protein
MQQKSTEAPAPGAICPTLNLAATLARSAGASPVRGRGPLKQTEEADTQSSRELSERTEAEILRAALNSPQVFGRIPEPLGKLFLCETTQAPQLRDPTPDLREGARGEKFFLHATFSSVTFLLNRNF